MRSISRAQRSAVSGRYSVDPNASSAMNSCARSASNARQTSSGRTHSCASQPAVICASPIICAIAVLPISGWAGQHRESVMRQYLQCSPISVRRHEHRRQLPGGIAINRRPPRRLGFDQGLQVTQAQQRRHRPTQLDPAVNPRPQLTRTQHPHLQLARPDDLRDRPLKPRRNIEIGQQHKRCGRRKILRTSRHQGANRVQQMIPVAAADPRALQQHRRRHHRAGQRRLKRRAAQHRATPIGLTHPRPSVHPALKLEQQLAQLLKLQETQPIKRVVHPNQSDGPRNP